MPNQNSFPLEELPLRKKKVTPLKENKPINYCISERGYSTILQLIRHVGISFEQTPSTFNIHKEEELRDIVLAFLNGYFEGGATGETFRKRGKTDICIEEKNRAAFVAECKIWQGEKELIKAVDQLLGYLTWRDVKTALVIFNKKNKNFKRLQKLLPETLKKHPKFEGNVGESTASEWKFVFRSITDEERKVSIQIFLFDLF